VAGAGCLDGSIQLSRLKILPRLFPPYNVILFPILYYIYLSFIFIRVKMRNSCRHFINLGFDGLLFLKFVILYYYTLIHSYGIIKREREKKKRIV
jgi:hypothetical protein